uniref:Uncharacterized protein n=1 Tax=Arundo donax TaxID=35708 RepID=A0A0A9HAL8_ARUDO
MPSFAANPIVYSICESGMLHSINGGREQGGDSEFTRQKPMFPSSRLIQLRPCLLQGHRSPALY